MLDSFQRYAHNIALIDSDQDKTVTYAELGLLVEKTGELFGDQKSLIFCLCQNSVTTIVTYLAALQKGHAICLLDANADQDMIDRLVNHYKPHFVVSEINISKRKGSDLHPDLQLLLSTSGTTGSPKLIRLTQKNLISNAESIATYLEINEQERAIASLPFHYSYGLSVLNSHLIRGASVILTEASVVQAPFWKMFNHYECTSFAGVPYTYQILDRLRFERFDLPTLKTMTQAGGKLSRELIEKFHGLMQKKSARFFVMYGQTEATARISYLHPKYLPKKLGSIGQAIPGGELCLEEGGELVYRGDNVMMGYATGPEDLVKGDQMQGVLRTGDLGVVDDDGFFFLTGRLKRISKVYGLRINLDEVEEVLRSFGPLAVTGSDEKLYLHFEEMAEERFGQCVDRLTEKYHLHHSTFEWRQVSQFPLTSSGKIDYTTLHEMTNAN